MIILTAVVAALVFIYFDDSNDPARMVLASSNTLIRRETKPCGFYRYPCSFSLPCLRYR